jgi:UDP:flavonoid glycosyltransferase YjiC (YdhE family)
MGESAAMGDGQQRPGAPAHILLTTFGSLGDLYPYLAIAIGLKTRGHAPVIATSERYREIVEARGISFAPIRPDLPEPAEMPELMRAMMDPRRGTEAVIRRAVLPFLRDSYEDLFTAAAGADLLVSHLLTFMTPLVADVRGIPWVSTALQPTALVSVHDPPVSGLAPVMTRLTFLGPWFWRPALRLVSRRIASWFAPLAELRAEIGLPPSAANPLLGNHSPWLTLALFSPLLAQPQPDWPEPTVVTGFPFLDPPGGPLSPALEDFLAAGPAPIVFTLGSSAVMTPGAFYAESARAAARLGQRAVLLAGAGAEALAKSLPDGVIAVDYAPHAALFPRASVIVHQGGIGTTAEAMRAGTPMLIVPFAHDQFDNAHRIERLGIGRALSREHYATGRAAQLLRLLAESMSIRWRAEVVGAEIRREVGVEAACEALEELLVLRGRGKPPANP